MPKLRVHNFAISLDGYGAGPDQSLEHPLGVGGEHLHEWAFATRTFHQAHGMEGGDEGNIDDAFAARARQGIGATIMGRNMFAPTRDRGETIPGLAGGATIRRFTTRCSCSRATRAHRSSCRVGPRSPSSTTEIGRAHV